MKTSYLMPVFLALLLHFSMWPLMAAPSLQDSGQDALDLYSTPTLMSLTEKWQSAFADSHPGFNIRVRPFSPVSMIPAEGISANLALLSSDDMALLSGQPPWKMVVGRDVVVALVSSANPFLEKIYEQGISAGNIARLIIDPQRMDWDNLLGLRQLAPVHIYIESTGSVRAQLADFLGVDLTGIQMTEMASEEALVEALAGDPYGIGFCRIPECFCIESSGEQAKVVFLPIDRNGNGKLDYHENIYGSLPEFMRGVWIGKYPNALVHSIYITSPEKPTEESALAFLKWTVTSGQQFLARQGYGELVNSERQSKVDALSVQPFLEQSRVERYAVLKLILFIVLAIAAAGLLSTAILKNRRKTRLDAKKASGHPIMINQDTLDIPGGLYYDKTHTWAFMDQCGFVKVGIDDFLQHVTGPYTRVQLKTTGEKVKKGEPLLTLVQEGKQLIVHAPVSGTIRDVNGDLAEEPWLVNMSPYDEGWVYLFEPTNWQRELQFLRMATAYKDWLRNEFIRLKDFLAVKINTRNFSYADVTLQEGGELTDHVLEKLGPEVWEEFQKHFIDTSY